jgi:UDP-GlcNAc:undecaprenyl-phosphate GlcNAc-1-phosphate transferase
MLGAAVAFGVAFFLALLLTPSVAQLAGRLGAVDRPDGRRKNHNFPVPLGGGVAVSLTTGVALAIALIVMWPLGGTSASWLVKGLLPSALVLLWVGIVDDVLTLTGIYKLIGQVLAVTVLVAAGSRFECISVFGYSLPLGQFCIPFTIFFCLGAINAFNLIDGADALASSIGAIVSATLGIISAAQGETAAALVCFALAGSLVGFLRYNIPPARIYLGDTGSMLIGLVVAAVAIESSIKHQAAFALAVPVAICAIPILDAAAALVRRITTGQSVFTPDRGHLHHVLLLRGWSVGRTVAFIAALATLTCGAALASYFTGNDLFALAITSGVFITLAIARIFGHAEVALIASRSRSMVRIVSQRGRRVTTDTESAVQLQGRRKWQKIWTALREAAPGYHVAGLTLQVSIPHLHESFYATWNRNDATNHENGWRLTLPLLFGDRPAGKLSAIGSSSGSQAVADMQQLLDFLESFESEIKETVADEQPAVPAYASVIPQLISGSVDVLRAISRANSVHRAEPWRLYRLAAIVSISALRAAPRRIARSL